MIKRAASLLLGVNEKHHLMKRYRILAYDFDARAHLLREEIQESWEEPVKEQWKTNKRRIREGLFAQYGVIDGYRKVDDFIDIGGLPISIIAFHNRFLRQILDAFVQGSYYPALTAACALGERILNQLVLHLRDDYTHMPEYRKLYRKSSFDNWDLVIDALENWGVLLPDVVKAFRELKDLRNHAIHFNPETDNNDRQLALDACRKLIGIVGGQFSGFGSQPWFISGAKGGAYIKREAESWPFIKRIVLPNCQLVGPYHRLENGKNGWVVVDEHAYEERDITDEEFVGLLKSQAPNQ